MLPSDGSLEMSIMLWTTNNGFPRVPNGIVTFVPTGQGQVRAASKSFPDAASVVALRALGIKSVVVLPEWLPGSDWDGMLERPIDGLPVTREQIGNYVLYRFT